MKFGPLRDLLKAKGDTGYHGMPLSAYGKLTLYKDYINLECTDGPAADFKKWMDGGFGLTFEEFGGKSVTLDGPRRLLWILPSGRHFAVAVIWPSTDEGGLRKFPFAFFTILARSALSGRSIPEGWLFLEPIWRCLERHYESASRLTDIDGFYEKFQSEKVDAPVDMNESEQDINLDTWMKSLSPGNPNAYCGRLENSLTDLINAYRGLSEQGEALAVRLPLTSKLPLIPQVENWERIFRENLKKCYAWPSMMLASTPPNGESAICMLWRPIRKEDARLFAADLDNYDYVEDIAGQTPTIQGDPPEERLYLGTPMDEWIGQFGKKA